MKEQIIEKWSTLKEVQEYLGVGRDTILQWIAKRNMPAYKVGREDGAIKAQLGTADMRLPIQYALYYPERRYLAGDRLDFSKIAGIITSKPDRETFKGLDFA